MIYWNHPATVSILSKLLDQDAIILASGDTVLGLWGNITQVVFDKLNMIKQRYDKPYLIVIGSVDKLPLFTDQIFSQQLQRKKTSNDHHRFHTKHHQ